VNAKLTQLNISNGGMPKLPIPSAKISVDGVAGDWQNDRKYHGGPMQAICLYSEELYDWLRTLDCDLRNGAFGENFTTRGVDMAKLKPGDRMRVGNCVIEITKVRTPCNNLKKWDPRMPALIKGNSGWYAKVITEAVVQQGDEIELLQEKGTTDAHG
jgi:MOSC domain-containing protein YiiM